MQHALRNEICIHFDIKVSIFGYVKSLFLYISIIKLAYKISNKIQTDFELWKSEGNKFRGKLWDTIEGELIFHSLIMIEKENRLLRM